MNIDSLIEEHNGLYIIHQQMPYPLKENNAYLAETDDGWAVIDLGIDIPQTRELWETAIRKAGLNFSSITKIIVTHCHPDHLGAAAWMQKMTEAPVYMSGIDIDIANKFFFLKNDIYKNYEIAINGNAVKYDFSIDKIKRLVADWCDNVITLMPEPSSIKSLDEDDVIILNDKQFRIKIFPGHTDGQLGLWNPDSRILFSGDVFAEHGYLHFNDWPNTMNENPLKDLLSSISEIEKMNPEIIYPGHGGPVNSYNEIFSKLRHRHNKLLNIFESIVTEPVTAGKLYEKVFPVPQTGQFADYIHHHRVLVGETAGYLNYLVSQGRLSCCKEESKNIYFKNADKD